MKNRKMKNAPVAKKLIASVSLLHASGRDVISGIFQYLEKSAGWSLSLMQPAENPLTVEKLHAAENDGTAGVLVAEYGPPELMCALATTPLPVVSIGVRDPVLLARKRPFALVRNDNAGIGATGASLFLKRGSFRSYGFVMAVDDAQKYAEERRAAFHDAVAIAAPMATRETFPPTKSPGSEEDIAALAKWISALPKPAAVMAPCDWRAVQTLEACNMANERVPDSVAILGVDNDEFLCDHTLPPLSSVQPNHVEMGIRAAELMGRLLKGKARNPQSTVFARCKKVVERESTMIRPPSAILVDRAKRFINTNATSRIGVKDVVTYLHVSRRLAEIRFRNATGKSIREAIEAARMVKLKRLLVSTRRPITALAEECGFGDLSSLAHLFKKRTGISMHDYRTKNRAK